MLRGATPEVFDLFAVPKLEDGLESLRTEPFGIVLLDLSLPDARNLEGLRRVDELCPDAPIIVLTDRNEESVALHAVQEGADDYLVKEGVGRQLLLRTIRYAMERKRTEGLLRRQDLELQQASKLGGIGQLAAGIAHEINTPMQYVLDNTRFLEESMADLTRILERYGELAAASKSGATTTELLDRLASAVEEADLDNVLQEIPEAIEQSLEGIGRVTKIVRAMKAFSHPGTEEKSPVNLNRAIETTVTLAHNECKYVAEIVHDLDPSLPHVTCLPGDINQVILNLL
ncbi:MAG: sensor histidine kinase, partial [Planctomycetota bacterium]